MISPPAFHCTHGGSKSLTMWSYVTNFIMFSPTKIKRNKTRLIGHILNKDKQQNNVPIHREVMSNLNCLVGTFMSFEGMAMNAA